MRGCPNDLMRTGEERQKEPKSGLSLCVGLNSLSLFFLVSLSIFDTFSLVLLSPPRQTDQ